MTRATFWTPERVTYLKRRAAEGAIYRVIADELGTTVGAVGSKARDLGIRRPHQPRGGLKDMRAASVPGNAHALRFGPARPPSAPVIIAPASIEGYPHAIGFFEQRAHLCKFPVGRATGLAQMFCGEAVERFGSYCPACRERAYTGRSVDFKTGKVFPTAAPRRAA